MEVKGHFGNHLIFEGHPFPVMQYNTLRPRGSHFEHALIGNLGGKLPPRLRRYPFIDSPNRRPA